MKIEDLKFDLLNTPIDETNFDLSKWRRENPMPYLDARPKAIYVGMNCLPHHAERLYCIGQELQVPVHKMVFDDFSEKFELRVTI